jgi:hypothetical protein
VWAERRIFNVKTGGINNDHWALKGLRFGVFAAASVEIVVFWVVTPWRRVRGTAPLRSGDSVYRVMCPAARVRARV